jgi:hypothetical protein
MDFTREMLKDKLHCLKSFFCRSGIALSRGQKTEANCSKYLITTIDATTSTSSNPRGPRTF